MTDQEQPRKEKAREEQPRNPLHGVTLEQILNELVEHFGWPTMGERIRVRCFTTNPSVASSLTFLRRTPWARDRVESMYLFMLREKARSERRQKSGGRPSAEQGQSTERNPGLAGNPGAELPVSAPDECHSSHD